MGCAQARRRSSASDQAGLPRIVLLARVPAVTPQSWALTSHRGPADETDRPHLDQMDLVELNEHSRPRCSRADSLGWNDPDRLNVNGGGISLAIPSEATAFAS